MVTLKSKLDWRVPTNSSILDEIWDAIWKYDVIRSVDINSFSISVEAGAVLLTGHLSRASNRQLIEEIVHCVPGVAAVDNRMVSDDDLTLQVAQALGQDARTRPLILPVGCSHGWVSLGGEVPTSELQLVAEEVAGQVPTVRGVVLLPRVIGTASRAARRALQPQLRAKAYDCNGQEGVVTQIVIQPRSRLVSHAAVRTHDVCDGNVVFGEHLVPVEAMEVVNKESLFLKRNGPRLNSFPIFKPSEYPLAPSDWQPPYPYAAGTVRWPCHRNGK